MNAVSTAALVYGEDGRREYFEVEDEAQRRLMAESMVALVSRDVADRMLAGDLDELPSWGQVDHLCAGEPFASQPAAAFCSGVLADRDLVLTARHCADLYAIDELRVVFGYYYETGGRLALTVDDVYAASAVLDTGPPPVLLAPERTGADYAWLRLARPARTPHRPAAIYTRAPALAPGASLVSVSTGGGAPLKLDAGGRVAPIDASGAVGCALLASTDTSGGSSGGGAFSVDLGLLGTLARGAPDYDIDPKDGCATIRHQGDTSAASEVYVYAAAAVGGLCATGGSASALCDPACAQLCRVVDPPIDVGGGCQVAPGAERPERGAGVLLLLVLLSWLRQAGARGTTPDARDHTRGRYCIGRVSAPRL